MISISVIIPVYNAEKFLRTAVESALREPETSEVILVEDGSSDNSLAICRQLASESSKVRLFQHVDGKNRGVSASRNLGLVKAQSEFIAFLDADDFFLPGRFKDTVRCFEINMGCDGVFEALGSYIQDQSSYDAWKRAGLDIPDLIVIDHPEPPERLFKQLITGSNGYLSLDCFVMKKSLLKSVGFLDETLRYFEDTQYFFRLAAVGSLFPGSIDKAVALRRVHPSNTIIANRSRKQKFEDRNKLWVTSYRWLRSKKLTQQSDLVIHRMVSHFASGPQSLNKTQSSYWKSIVQRLRMLLLLTRVPDLVFRRHFWAEFLPDRFNNPSERH